MNSFDYTTHKVIGIPTKKYSTMLHASIIPVGYEDDNFHFQPFNKEELKELFPHKGTIHGHYCPNCFVDKLVIFELKKYDKDDDETKDVFTVQTNNNGNYIMDYYGSIIQDIDKNKLIEAINNNQYDTYFRIDNKIYYITKEESNNGFVKYWYINEQLFYDNPNQFLRFNDKIFSIRDDISSTPNYMDILNDEEICDYVIKQIKTYDIDINNLLDISMNLIKKIKIPTQILFGRFKLFNDRLSFINMTHKEVLDLALNPILSDVIKKSINTFETGYIGSCKAKNNDLFVRLEQSKNRKLKEIEDQIESVRKDRNNKIVLIEKEIKEEKEKLDIVIDTLKSKEQEIKIQEQKLSYIDEHKDHIIQDFSIIQDVIGNQQNNNKCILKKNIENVISKGDKITDIRVLINKIYTNLLNNDFSQECADELSKVYTKMFISKNKLGKNAFVILIPNNIPIFKSFLDAIGQYKLCSVCVGPNWKSYEDLYYSGLRDMIISANNNPKDIHILLLQNMNLSFIPSYMQPLNDILSGISSKLPGENNENVFPDNLWIFGTRIDFNQDAIPISKSQIENYGCIENKEYAICDNNDYNDISNNYIDIDLVNSKRMYRNDFKNITKPDSYLD